MTFSPTYIEKRLLACRELEALECETGGWPGGASDYRKGLYDATHDVTRHFPAYDAGSASRDDEVDALRDALEFYADHKNWWGTYVASSKSPMFDDWGDPTYDFLDGKPGTKARAALEGAQ